MIEILGIDVGGTGVKGAIVNTLTGELLSEKIKYATPKPSTPKNVSRVVSQLISDFNWKDKPMGYGFPSIIKKNICYSAANIDNAWIGLNLSQYFLKINPAKAIFINDADAAGIAEMRFGVGYKRSGTVLMLTLGTGIGSGLFVDGVLVPNTEFGHLLYKRSIFEHYASNSARRRKNLSWSKWGKELNVYLQHIEFILNPDLVILGGGVSKKFDSFKNHIDIACDLIPAFMQNNAGIIGAAIVAADSQ